MRRNRTAGETLQARSGWRACQLGGDLAVAYSPRSGLEDPLAIGLNLDIISVVYK